MATATHSDFAGKFFAIFFIGGGLLIGAVLGANYLASLANPQASTAADARVKADDAAEATARTLQQEEKVRAEEKVATEAREQERAYKDANQALNSVRATLFDPGSAQFKDVWAVKATYAGATSTFACGSVNGKNRLGGYVGFQPFVAIGSTVLTPDDSMFPQVFQTACLDGQKLFPVGK